MIQYLRQFLTKLNPYAHRPYVRELLALRAINGPYRFLVRNWVGQYDINLAAKILETEFFKPELVPVRLPFEKNRCILVLAPHQDDEVIGAGGTLLLAADLGIQIHIVYMTDGFVNDVQDSVAVRDGESNEVCQSLGATKHQLGISNVNPRPCVDDLDRLAEIICTLNPDIVLAPWLLDSPAKHRLVNHLLWLANQRRQLPDIEVWGYQVHNVLFPNGYIDVTDVAARKRKLLEIYQSQNRFLYRYDHLAMGMSAWNARFHPDIKGDSIPHYVEVFFALPIKEFFRLVEKFYFVDFGATYRGQQHVIAGVEKLHKYISENSMRHVF